MSPTATSLHRRPQRGRAHGFTLIELMIALVVVSVLAMVALPSFLQQVRKGHRSDAEAAINAVLQAQERWRGDNTTYSASMANLVAANLGVATTSSLGYYTIATSTATASAGYAYVVTATAVGSQTNDSACTVMTLTANQRSSPSLSYTPAACWGR